MQAFGKELHIGAVKTNGDFIFGNYLTFDFSTDVPEVNDLASFFDTQ